MTGYEVKSAHIAAPSKGLQLSHAIHRTTKISSD
jgi:hypothetical protein